jgi:hypothetical protein
MRQGGGCGNQPVPPLQYILQYVLQHVHVYAHAACACACACTCCSTYCSMYCRGGACWLPQPPPDPAGLGRLPGPPGQGRCPAPGPRGPALPKPLSPAELRGAKRQFEGWPPPPRLRWQFCHLKPYFVT